MPPESCCQNSPLSSSLSLSSKEDKQNEEELKKKNKEEEEEWEEHRGGRGKGEAEENKDKKGEEAQEENYLKKKKLLTCGSLLFARATGEATLVGGTATLPLLSLNFLLGRSSGVDDAPFPRFAEAGSDCCKITFKWCGPFGVENTREESGIWTLWKKITSIQKFNKSNCLQANLKDHSQRGTAV